jgi:hypothetical protein
VRRFVVLAVMIVCLAGVGFAQDEELPIHNWVAPPYWNPAVHPQQEGVPEGGMLAQVQGMRAQAQALPSSPLPFVAIPPCRIVDTRVAVSDGFHQPNFIDDEARTFPFPASPDCPGLPSLAGAWSVNIQFRPISQLAFLTAYPTGTTRPGVSTMTAGPAAWVQNSAIVPAGTGGAIDIYCQYAGRVVIDVNGYYGPQSVVTSLNMKTGDITLAEGSNITITPSGNTLTIDGLVLPFSGTASIAGLGAVIDVTNTGAGTGLRGFSGGSFGVVGESTSWTGVFGGSTSGLGVHGRSATSDAVFGESTDGAGVYGISASYDAVQGATDASDHLSAGVRGLANAAFGVAGQSTSWTGVYGASGSGWGVHGTSASSIGVAGVSTSGPGVSGGSSTGDGIQGATEASDQLAAGVRGTSTSSFGVVGTSTSWTGVFGSSTSGPGVHGRSEEADGILAEASADGKSAIFAQNTNPNAYAGFFDGHVRVTNGLFSVAMLPPGPVCADAVGALVPCGPSDLRLKRDVRDLTASLDVFEALSSLRGVTFSWDTTVEAVRNMGSQRELGLIAQDVERVLPEAVRTDTRGYRAVDYAKLTAFLVEVAKAQQAEIERLEARVVSTDALETQLRQLQRQVQALMVATGAAKPVEAPGN